MKHFAPRAAALLLAALLTSASHAGPGAHGPNGEHLDGDSAPSNAVASNDHRMEAASEDFELVATLADDELSILIDRFATNEPVLGARVEVESGSLKAVAKFHADHGDYAVADEAFLKALARPGNHPLVFTVVAGTESDLLEGVLKVSAPVPAADDHAHLPRWMWVAAASALSLAAAITWRLRRRKLTQGALA